MKNELLELKTLARRINDQHEAAAMLSRKTAELGRQAVLEASLCGAMLIEAKAKMGNGRWLGWCEKNLKVSQTTICKWMRLASRLSQEQLASARGLRHAYILCGILPELPEDQQGEAKPAYQVAMTRLNGFIKTVGTTPISDWPIDTVEDARVRLAPFVAALWPEAAEKIMAERGQRAARVLPGG